MSATPPAIDRPTVDAPPPPGPGPVCRLRWREPADTPGRAGEGGLRLAGRFKASRPGAPLVTIVTVCLNAAATLRQTIDSVRAQTWQNLEYIVVDGGSVDGTRALLEANADTIDYWVSEPDGGLYRAMNKGLALASGDAILLLNADDWYTPDAVASLVRAWQDTGCDLVSARAEYVDGEGRSSGVLRSMPFDASTRLRMPLRHETMLVPAAVYDRHGPYDERLRIIADFALTMRLFDAGATHFELPRPLLHFRTTGVSSTQHDRVHAERRTLLAVRFPCLDAEDLDLVQDMSRLRPPQVRALADKHLAQRDLVEALRALALANERRSDAPAWSGHPIDWAEIEQRSGRPLVSVILPMYAAEATVAEAIDSVRAQTLERFELLCIDDASPDGGRAIAEAAAAADPRVRVLVNPVNIGLGATRNRGVREAAAAHVFHLDPDDVIPPDALLTLWRAATQQRSEMVKGAYLREQMIHGQAAPRPERRSLCRDGQPRLRLKLADAPDLLGTTEGHWSYLYETAFARRVPYPTDLKMGQDSIFLVQALAQATSVSVLDDVVYRYRANAASAMNTFNLRKYRDGVEWRRRAWQVLSLHGHRAIGDRLLSAYWSEDFFRTLAASAAADDALALLATLGRLLREAGLSGPSAPCAPAVRAMIEALAQGREAEVLAALRAGAPVPAGGAAPAPPKPAPQPVPMARDALRVATFCSMDHGGAGTGSQRRVQALRRRGIDATLHALVVRSREPYVRRVKTALPAADNDSPATVWERVRERAVLPAKAVPGFRASELFSLPETVVDFRQLKPVFDAADVLHFHWVVGLFDHDHAGEVLGDRPVVWTLADMNAFTGGCHYAEGCEGFKQSCQACPLLGGQSDLAHQAWKRKKAAYDAMPHLHVICPSGWLADLARSSSLFGDKPVHHVPNAFPVDRFTPTAKMAARARLGLPLDRRLLLFGADSLDSKRKGGEQLREALGRLRRQGTDEKVDVVVFGHRAIDLPLPVHPMGHISDDTQLALVYSAADAFVFPSHEDNAPLTVGESMLCGTPVVAFPVGNVPELVRHRDTGYLARHLDAADLADGIRWVLSTPPAEAIRRSLRCRIQAARFHDPDQAVDRHRAIYDAAMRSAAEARRELATPEEAGATGERTHP